jgi:hypothetical protein
MKIQSWKHLEILMQDKTLKMKGPETTSKGFCLVYESIEDCIADGEDPNNLIVVQQTIDTNQA